VHTRLRQPQTGQMKASTSLNHSSSIWRGANSKMGILSKGKELDVNKDWGGSNRSHRHGSGKTGMSTSASPRSNSTSSSSTWTRGRTRGRYTQVRRAPNPYAPSLRPAEPTEERRGAGRGVGEVGGALRKVKVLDSHSFYVELLIYSEPAVLAMKRLV
jgi:hypothetical protein